MLRLYLRRDRIVLPLWVLLLSTPLATRLRRRHREGLPGPGSARRLRREHHGQSRAAGAVRKHLQRQPRCDRRLESRHVPSADRRGGHPHRHPPHPRRRGNRPSRTDRLDRGRPLRQPDRGVGVVVRGRTAHRCARRGRSAGHQRRAARVAGVRCGAGLLRSGVHRGCRSDSSAFGERPVRPRGRIRRARHRVHTARRR